MATNTDIRRFSAKFNQTDDCVTLFGRFAQGRMDLRLVSDEMNPVWLLSDYPTVDVSLTFFKTKKCLIGMLKFKGKNELNIEWLLGEFIRQRHGQITLCVIVILCWHKSCHKIHNWLLDWTNENNVYGFFSFLPNLFEKLDGSHKNVP